MGTIQQNEHNGEIREIISELINKAFIKYFVGVIGLSIVVLGGMFSYEDKKTDANTTAIILNSQNIAKQNSNIEKLTDRLIYSDSIRTMQFNERLQRVDENMETWESINHGILLDHTQEIDYLAKTKTKKH